MKDVYYDNFVQIRLILDGAIRLFENEGSTIFAKLLKEDKDGLSTAMDSIGEALYWARTKANDALLHGLSSKHAPSAE